MLRPRGTRRSLRARQEVVALARPEGGVNEHVSEPARFEHRERFVGFDGFEPADVLGEPVGPHALVGQRREGDARREELVDELEHLVARAEQHHHGAVGLFDG